MTLVRQIYSGLSKRKAYVTVIVLEVWDKSNLEELTLKNSEVWQKSLYKQ